MDQAVMERGVIGRRAVLAASLVVPVVAKAALPVPPGGRIGFQMRRNGDVIGQHTLSFALQGSELVVSVAIDILVKFGPIPVYRYSHRATERWLADRFMGIDSKTDRDGTDHFVHAERRPAGVVVEGSKARTPYVAPEDALPTTYWNRTMLSGRVINSESGQLMAAPVTVLAEENVPLASGASMVARHYRLGGDLPLDLWYDSSGQWSHLVFTKEGSTVIYEKL